MRRGGFVVVLATFGLLAWLWLRREEAVQRDVLHVYDHPLAPALVPERVACLRIDHLARGVQVRLERDAAGRWLLSDPVAYPGYAERVRKLFEVLARERGVLEPGADPAQLGLEPPQAVLEVDQRGEDGTRTLRIELGALDVDPLRVHVRVPGHPAAPPGEEAAVLLIPRTLVGLLEHDSEDWRDPRLTPFHPGSVRRFARRGDSPFEALSTGDGWRTAGEGSVRLDPDALGLLLRCATDLRVRDFVDDSPDAPARFGLDQPDFELDLDAGPAGPLTLSFRRHGRKGRWLVRRSDRPNVVEVERSDAQLLLRPVEALWDQNLLRLLRERVREVRLRREEGELVLARAGGRWSVVLEGAPYPADEGAVGDLLSGLEEARVAAFVPQLGFPADAPPLGFSVLLDDGTRQGAEVGPAWRDAATGIEGRLVRRPGEGAVGVADEALAGLCRTPAEELRSRVAHLVPQRLVRQVALSHGGEEQLYVQVGARWRPHGLELDAPRAFLDLLDHLLGLRVEAWEPPGAQAPLAERVDVRIAGSFGEPLAFSLGRAGGEPVVELESGVRGRVRAGLVEDVLGLFAP